MAERKVGCNRRRRASCSFTHTWRWWNACSHLWKFASWKFICRALAVARCPPSAKSQESASVNDGGILCPQLWWGGQEIEDHSTDWEVWEFRGRNDHHGQKELGWLHLGSEEKGPAFQWDPTETEEKEVILMAWRFSSPVPCLPPAAAQFVCLFFNLSCVACGLLVPQPGVEPGPQQWKRWVLTTGPSERFQLHGERCPWCLSVGAADISANTQRWLPPGTWFPELEVGMLLQGTECALCSRHELRLEQGA